MNKIPVHNLNMNVFIGAKGYVEEIMQGEIEGLCIFHKAYTDEGNFTLKLKQDHATVLLILKGSGQLIVANQKQALEAESLVLFPNDIHQASIQLAAGQKLHFLELTKRYSAEDKKNLSLQEHPVTKLFYTRFKDCTPYTEKIKSPNTISRTILPGAIVPRLALGTVEASGPDQVGAHRHPMLEQLFLGLQDNEITVYADDDFAVMKAFSLLHIPLGSTHSVEVEADSKMNYMWMDFFLTKDGEEWLNTHKPIL